MRWLVLAAVALAGCSSAKEPTTSAALPNTTASPSSSAPAPKPAPSYAVHEWGLMDVAANGPAEIAAGPGNALRPVRKPVLYVRLDDGLDALTFSAHVAIPGGKIIERWPLGEMSGEAALDWTNVTAARAHCNTNTATRAARRDAPADGIDEVGDLPLYDAPGAACLTLGDASGSMLFYRGAVPTLALPLTVARQDDFSAKVSTAPGAKGLGGDVIRVSTAMSGPWPPGKVVISRAAIPAPGASASLPLGTAVVDRDAEEGALRSAMQGLGLAGDEADAFVRAWSASLFGAPTTVRELPSARFSAGRWMPQDVIMYWLPRADIDRILPLSFDPPPRELRRAMLVRVDLGAVATAGPAVSGVP